MKRIKLVILLSLIYFTSFTQAPFTAGNIVVSRIGDGSIPLTDMAHPVFLDEYTPAGTLVQTVALPTSVVGANKILSLSAFDDYVPGSLTLSPNGQFLTIAGFNAPIGTSNSVLVDGTVTQKTIGIIDFNANINTSTALADAGDHHAYGAVTSNGTDIWACFLTTGLRYTQVGNSTSNSIVTPTVFRRVAIRNNQLYSTASSGAVVKIGSGLPTAPGNSFAILSGIGTGSFSQFFFADLDPSIPGDDVIYVVNEGAPALRKYSLNGSSWVLNGQIGIDEDNYLGITGTVVGTSVKLYIVRGATNSSAASGELVTLTDNTGYNLGAGTFVGTPTTLKSASTNTTIRGVALVPQPTSISLSTKVLLAGEYNAGLGRHSNVTTARVNALNSNSLNQPFNVAPFNYAGSESVSAGFFSTDDGVTTDIVDWVLVELHDATTPSTIVARKACFIREDGKIVDLDKVSDPTFTGIAANNYFIVVKSRNHLAIRSSSTIFVNGASPVLYDFTTAQSQAYQNPAVTTNAAMRNIGGVFCMWSGNANMNNNVRYTGLNNDAAALLAALSGNQASVLNPSYSPADINGDGIVRYTGLNNDAAALLSSLGGNQAAVLTEHQ